MAKKTAVPKMNDVQKWRGRLDVAENRFDQAAVRHGWYRFIDYFHGNYQYHIGVNIPVSEVNQVYAYIKTSVASLYFRNPYIAVNAKTKAAITSAFIKEAVVNYYWREKRYKQKMKKCIAEAKLVGFSYFKQGYDADIRKDETVAGEVAETVVAEDIWGIHVPFNQIYYDPDSRDPLYDARWCTHWFWRPTDYLNEKYPNLDIKPTAKSSVQKMSHQGAGAYGGVGGEDKSDIKMTRVYEIWDKDTRGRYLMCDGCDEWLEEPQIAKEDGMIGLLKEEGFPIKMLRFNDIIGHYDNFPQGDMEPLEELVLEKIKIRSMMLNHLKRFNRQMFIRKGMLSPKMLDKYETGQDGAIIESEMDLGPQNIWSPQYPQIQTDIYAIENRIDVDFDRVSGMPSFEQGAPANTKTRTLGEVQASAQGAMNRRNEQIDIVEDFCEEVARGMIGMMKQYFDIDKIVRIADITRKDLLLDLAKQGKFDGEAITFTKEDIQGEEDVDVQMGSTIPLNKENRLKIVQELIRFGSAIGLVPGTRASAALGLELIKDLEFKVVEDAFRQDMIALLQPKQPDPREMLKMEKDKAGTENTKVDTALKMNRIQKGQLDLVGKQIGNMGSLVENRKKMQDLESPKSGER